MQKKPGDRDGRSYETVTRADDDSFETCLETRFQFSSVR
jgi:hypothetical protein